MKPPLRVPFVELEAGDRILPADTARYVTRVHRRRAGARLLLFDPLHAREASATLVDADERRARVEVEAPRQAQDQSMPVRLVQAIGKGDKPEQAVRDATVFGARELVFVHSDRSVARSSGLKRGDRLLRVAVEAARQCGRGNLPTIHGPESWSEALERSAGRDLRLILSCEDGARSLLARVSSVDWSSATSEHWVTALIGPEGGFSPAEEEAASRGGFLQTSLGPYVLRTEVALAATLAVLSASWAAALEARRDRK